jgi:hypothetical protein
VFTARYELGLQIRELQFHPSRVKGTAEHSGNKNVLSSESLLPARWLLNAKSKEFFSSKDLDDIKRCDEREKCITLARRPWSLRKRCVCWHMLFGEDSSIAVDKNCRPFHPTGSWSSQCYCLMECDTVQSPKCIKTLHRTDCCSYIFTARWSRGQRFSSKLARHLTKHPQNRESHSHCCGELKTYSCIRLSCYCLDVSKRRRVRVILWCLPYWTSLRSFFALVRLSKSSRISVFQKLQHRRTRLIIK